MHSPSPHETAIARWFAHGVTSRTHPLLRFALDRFLAPLGIEADWLEAEPFSALEAGGGWWLRGPRWNAAAFDRSGPAAADFSGLWERPDGFHVAVDAEGVISLALAEDGGQAGPARDYLTRTGRGWAAIRHSVRASRQVESFLHGAAGLILADGRAAALYAAGEDGAFGAEVLRRLGIPPATATAAGGRADDPGAEGTATAPDARRDRPG